MRLWNYDKFWVIWCSCVDKPRTIKEIQRIWDYKGNALYQKGMRKPIRKEMLDDGFIEDKGKIKERGVSGNLIYAKLDWVPKFLYEFFLDLKLKYNNVLPSQLFDCIVNKKRFIKFLDENRDTFFFPDRLKVLFSDKDTLKNHCEMCLVAPMLVMLNLLMLRVLEKQLKLKKEMLFIVTQSMVFNPAVKLNFFDYSRLVMKDLKMKSIPGGIFDEKKVFVLWMKSAQKIYSDLVV